MSHSTSDSEEKTIPNTLGQRLQKARQRKGLSQSDLGKKLFFGKQTVSSWEHDRTEPSLATLKLISVHLETPLIELIQD